MDADRIHMLIVEHDTPDIRRSIAVSVALTSAVGPTDAAYSNLLNTSRGWSRSSSTPAEDAAWVLEQTPWHAEMLAARASAIADLIDSSAADLQDGGGLVAAWRTYAHLLLHPASVA